MTPSSAHIDTSRYIEDTPYIEDCQYIDHGRDEARPQIEATRLDGPDLVLLAFLAAASRASLGLRLQFLGPDSTAPHDQRNDPNQDRDEPGEDPVGEGGSPDGVRQLPFVGSGDDQDIDQFNGT